MERLSQALSDIQTAVEERIRPGATTLELEGEAIRQFQARNILPAWRSLERARCSALITAAVNNEVINTAPTWCCHWWSSRIRAVTRYAMGRMAGV